MTFTFEEKLSDSPLVGRVWRTQSDEVGSFTSQAVSNWEIVVWTYEGQTNVTLRGPETRATVADTPADAEFFGIQFKLGTLIPHLPTTQRINSGLDLPKATSQSFWLNGSAWQFPEFENIDVFVKRLERSGLLVQDPIVNAVLQKQETNLSSRTVRRRFLQATGLTPKVIQQIERAKEAAQLLEQGSPIADVVYQTGFADQPHLTRSLKHFLGLTPALMFRTKAE